MLWFSKFYEKNKTRIHKTKHKWKLTKKNNMGYERLNSDSKWYKLGYYKFMVHMVSRVYSFECGIGWDLIVEDTTWMVMQR